MADSARRYHGPSTGINWCEEDYAKTKYIAEFWNTFTNIVYVYVGLKSLLLCRQKRLPTRFYLIACFILLTGITSGMFHATLHLKHQRLDEIFENASMISIFHTLSSLSIYSTTTSTELYVVWHFFLCTMGIVFCAYFLFCEIHLIGISIWSGRVLYQFALSPKERCLGKLKSGGSQRGATKGSLMLQRVNRTLLLALLGGVCWLLDRLACEQLSKFRFGYVQLHAWWHVFTGLALHEIFVLAAALHMYRYRKVKTDGEDVDTPLHYVVPLKHRFMLSQLV